MGGGGMISKSAFWGGWVSRSSWVNRGSLKVVATSAGQCWWWSSWSDVKWWCFYFLPIFGCPKMVMPKRWSKDGFSPGENKPCCTRKGNSRAILLYNLPTSFALRTEISHMNYLNVSIHYLYTMNTTSWPNLSPTRPKKCTLTNEKVGNWKCNFL